MLNTGDTKKTKQPLALKLDDWIHFSKILLHDLTGYLPNSFTTLHNYNIFCQFFQTCNKPHHTPLCNMNTSWVIHYSTLPQKVLTRTTTDLKTDFTTPHGLGQISRTFHNPQ